MFWWCRGGRFLPTAFGSSPGSVQREGARGSYGWRGPALGAAGGEVGAAGVAGTARYFSITSRSPFWKWRSAPTVRNPCEGEADQPGAGCACALLGTVPVPATGSGLSQPCSRTAWLVTTSLVKSMPSGSGICTPFLVLSAGRRHSEQRAPAPAQPLRAGGCLPLMMGMMVSCSRVFSGACSENSCGRGEDRREGECPAGGLPGRTGCACASQGLGSPPFPPPTAPSCAWGLLREVGPPRAGTGSAHRQRLQG